MMLCDYWPDTNDNNRFDDILQQSNCFQSYAVGRSVEYSNLELLQGSVTAANKFITGQFGPQVTLPSYTVTHMALMMVAVQ